MKLSRNTLRRILRSPAASPPDARAAGAREASCPAPVRLWLPSAFERARGNAVRIQEMLAAEMDLRPGYSTLTRWIREADLRTSPKRAGAYHFAPGQEMQHDTSPHRVILAGKPLTAQCASLILAYSRRLFVQYFARFTRFEAKQFLLDAVRFMAGSCATCVIYNTSVIVVAGAGDADHAGAIERRAVAGHGIGGELPRPGGGRLVGRDEDRPVRPGRRGCSGC